ncbi:DUF5837 family protein [Nostoc sp. CHAB 5784]|uniref:DUF5837 family cyanobactin class RiPP n=1 Tax=Nostoc mirabile TaxID=2907820 RepID=UPI001E3386DF|nr:DUF5837 family cyanobactin class RiPP [Nostoc mirabile]MCC5669249.1 DUF5837 family protein [Nostoc mirabile CHAB5784]
MDKKNLMPQAAQPVNRIGTGQVDPELAELSEEALQLHGDEACSASVLASFQTETPGTLFGYRVCLRICSYDGDEE